MNGTYPRAVRYRINQSGVKKLFYFFFDDVVDFWINPPLTLHFRGVVFFDEDEGDGEEDQGLRISKEERLNEEEEAEELYKDVNINQGRGIQVTLDVKDSHVTLTPVHPDDRLKSLKASFSEYKQTNPFAEAISNIPSIVHQYINQQMTEAVSANESAFIEETEETTSQMDEPVYPVFDTLTPKLLAGPTYELMKGSCTSLIELEYHLEEVYKATTDQLDWVNPEGQQYPHNLLQPLPLIPDNRDRHVIPFAHFINNDLKYLQRDLVPRTMWIQEPIDYDKHALWGVSHWGHKCQQFYGFAVNRESALDVYSKRRIIAVTDLKIVKWDSYKHLDWISIRRDDDKIYKFKEGDFKRLRLQDIEDMLLLLVQRKLSNLTVEERFAFNVSLRMFTRSIVIQRRVEDLQLGVKSYQKRLNLTKPDTYWSDLKRRESYTAYLNPQGFIYQNKDKKN
nr:hypothetical protein [Tanacetum cinerariifolium]